MGLPHDYAERVYAGVLGKIIGVYLGRPFEGWSYDRIMAELGEITYYVHEKLKVPLIVTDDDISGTFTFLRALPDYGNSRHVTPQQIGQTWLNYIIERRTILWWGGLGNSTEHTAYLRLKSGIPAPRSGSIALNGKVVAEQIGSQIFIDGWAMVAPGDPQLAADLARRASLVSHDGEAVYGAQVVAAMEALAFVERDINTLIDTAVSLIPRDSVIYRMIHDIRTWHAAEPDWRKTRERIATHYGYDTYGGNCHMVPNHGLIIHALLHGEGDFQTSLTIVNTCGWDTDCNSGNVGCLLGIRNGLAGLETGLDWRGPVADRLYVAAADPGRVISDAATEAIHIVNSGRALAGDAPLTYKNGARFHFELPGSVQGFQADTSMESRGTVIVENVIGHSITGSRSLALRYKQLAPGRVARVSTPTFIPPDALSMPGYSLMAAPTLYPGQTLRAGLSADATSSQPVICRLAIAIYGPQDELTTLHGPALSMAPDSRQSIDWRIADTGGYPIATVGLEISAPPDAQQQVTGTIYLDYVTWDGVPDMVLTRPATGGSVWRRAWVDGLDQYDRWWPELFRLVHNEGTGLLLTGAREWSDYRVSADLTPHLAATCGLGIRVQGMRRYYALLLAAGGDGATGVARLIKALDGSKVLAEVPFPWSYGQRYDLSVQANGTHLQAWIDDRLLFEVDDLADPLDGGGIALLCEEGRTGVEAVTVSPIR